MNETPVRHVRSRRPGTILAAPGAACGV